MELSVPPPNGVCKRVVAVSPDCFEKSVFRGVDLRRGLTGPWQLSEHLRVLVFELYDDGLIMRSVETDEEELLPPSLHLDLTDDLGTEYVTTQGKKGRLHSGVSHHMAFYEPAVRTPPSSSGLLT